MPREMVVCIVLLFLVATGTCQTGSGGSVNIEQSSDYCPRPATLTVSASCAPCPHTEPLPAVQDTINECHFFVASQTSDSSFFSSSGQRTPVDLQGGPAIQIAYLKNKRSILYTTGNKNSVYKYTFDTIYPIVHQAEVAHFDGPTFGIAVDAQADSLWVGEAHLGVVAVKDKKQVTFPQIPSADVALAVDEIKKYLFFSDYNLNRLSKMNYQDLNNTGDVVIIKTEFPSRPRDLLTDKPAQTLYILLENGEIWTMNLMDDTDIGPRMSAPTTNTGAFALSMCGDDLYYTDQIAQVVWKILKSQLNGDERVEVTYAPSPAGLAVINFN